MVAERIGEHLVLVERPGDRAKSLPHRYTTYAIAETEPGRPFRLDPAAELFILREHGFYKPRDWHLVFRLEPYLWYTATMAAIHDALASVVPRTEAPFRDAAPRALAS